MNIKSYEQWKEDKEAGTLNGWYRDVPNESYHKGPGHGSSAHKEIAISPGHYKSYIESEFSSNSSVGTITHLRVLEPEKFDLLVELKLDGRTKAGKEQKARAEDEEILLATPREYEQAVGMGDAILANPEIAHMLQSGENELSGYATHPEYGFLMKIRPDSYLTELKWIVDLKTTARGATDTFLERMIFNKKWHWQSAFYVYVNQLITGEEWKFLHVFAEDSAPYAIKPRYLNEASIEKSFEELSTYFGVLDNCIKSNEWPCYGSEIMPLALPDWAWSKHEAVEVY